MTIPNAVARVIALKITFWICCCFSGSSCLVNFVLFRGERAWVAKQLPGGLRLRAVGYAPGQSDGGAQGRGCRAAALSRG